MAVLRAAYFIAKRLTCFLCCADAGVFNTGPLYTRFEKVYNHVNVLSAHPFVAEQVGQ